MTERTSYRDPAEVVLSCDDALHRAADLLAGNCRTLRTDEDVHAEARALLNYVSVLDQRAAVAAAQSASDRGYAMQRRMAMPLTEAVSLVEEMSAASFDNVTGSTLRNWIRRAKELNQP